VPSLPPRLELVNAFDIVRRYQASASCSSESITRQLIAAAAGAIVYVANTSVGLMASGFRLRGVTIWPASASSVLWDVNTNSGSGAEQALSKESAKNEIVPTGIVVTAPLHWVPKRGTYLDMWQSTFENGSDVLFKVSGAAGFVLDLHLTVTLTGCTAAAAHGLGISSTYAVGQVVVPNLDTGNKVGIIGYQPANSA